MLLTIYSQTWFTQNIQNEQPHEIRNEFNELNFLFTHEPTQESLGTMKQWEAG